VSNPKEQEKMKGSPLEKEVAKYLVSALALEIKPEDIDPEAPLFYQGLGLDSIDALEISVMVHQHYGFEVKSDDPENTDNFSSLRALCRYIEKHRVKP
jgi:acyl carrier protein